MKGIIARNAFEETHSELGWILQGDVILSRGNKIIQHFCFAAQSA